MNDISYRLFRKKKYIEKEKILCRTYICFSIPRLNTCLYGQKTKKKERKKEISDTYRVFEDEKKNQKWTRHCARFDKNNEEKKENQTRIISKNGFSIFSNKRKHRAY